ncbi:serine hydrolase [Acuticoccus sp. I52.16.1]|uniref:serine hydrolase domain-containing protein n=1 Tax=Acuticoccus sp. I52.16.1 TaxID=2928472 RepID=UPI001FD56E51|nr:serine hydrolase [Acuticoccus sp. I52.16.1]UOM33017.1 beta-lactamase family protein [Acuticoccus sp. I52.16.1]
MSLTRRHLMAALPRVAAVAGTASRLRFAPRGFALAAAPAGAASARTEAENGMETLGDRIDHAHTSGVLADVHAILVRRGARTVARYFSGADNAWGRDLGTVTFGPQVLHDLRSITKSVVSLLYAVALERGEVPPPDAPLLAQFPAYADLAAEPPRAAWTVAHALDMTMGTHWNEDLPYSDPNNSEIAMERAPDRFRFVLDRPLAAAPGTEWRYNGGATALIGHLIERGMEMDLPSAARRHLFDPLGIETTEWVRGADGTASAASGLRMTAPDLAKIGRLVLDGGVWDGRRVVPADWIASLATPAAHTPFGLGYARQWYTSEQPVDGGAAVAPMLSGMGNGGQRLFVLPGLDLVAVLFCGRYDQPDQWLNPVIVLQRLILADV